MAYELKQELKLSQKLLLTPQLKLAIKLLQLSRQELVETVKSELESNPVLNEDEGEGETSGEDVTTESGTLDTEGQTGAQAEEVAAELKSAEDGSRMDMDWQSYLEDNADYNTRRGIDFSVSDEEGGYGEGRTSPETLTEHLSAQLRHSINNNEDGAATLEIGEFIIGNIDEDGYLVVLEQKDSSRSLIESRSGDLRREAISEIARLIDVTTSEVEDVLSTIEGFDPPGVGAVSTKECLLLQARRLPVRDTLVESIIDSHLEALATRNFRHIARVEGTDTQSVALAAEYITERLNPHPGAGYGSAEATVVIPDAYIKKVGEDYLVTLNEDGLPRLRISSYYRELIHRGQDKDKGAESDARTYVQDKLRSAMWLIKSVEQRQRTLLKVVESITKKQLDFLDKGVMHLKPMVLREVAEDIEMHESTISRVTTNKYVHTPRGIFELKYFFTGSMACSDGTDVSVNFVKERIKSIIDNEDPTTPLSDQQIADMLKTSSLVVARRTVAKYREELGFDPSSRRKLYM